MDLIKRTLFVLIALFVVVLIWVGLYIYFESSEISVNPNAETYQTQLESSFDLEELEMVYERTQEAFPVTPEVFLSLVEES